MSESNDSPPRAESPPHHRGDDHQPVEMSTHPATANKSKTKGASRPKATDRPKSKVAKRSENSDHRQSSGKGSRKDDRSANPGISSLSKKQGIHKKKKKMANGGDATKVLAKGNGTGKVSKKQTDRGRQSGSKKKVTIVAPPEKLTREEIRERRVEMREKRVEMLEKIETDIMGEGVDSQVIWRGSRSAGETVLKRSMHIIAKKSPDGVVVHPVTGTAYGSSKKKKRKADADGERRHRDERLTPIAADGVREVAQLFHRKMVTDLYQPVTALAMMDGSKTLLPKHAINLKVLLTYITPAMLFSPDNNIVTVFTESVADLKRAMPKRDEDGDVVPGLSKEATKHIDSLICRLCVGKDGPANIRMLLRKLDKVDDVDFGIHMTVIKEERDAAVKKRKVQRLRCSTERV